MRVWLIGTFHEERGRTSVANLEMLLERICPEVIFLECPPSALDDVLDGTRPHPEFAAAGSYHARHGVDLVPVDLPTPPQSFFHGTADLFMRVEDESPDYCRLLDRNGEDLAAHGFPYLNSDRCRQLWSDLYEATRLVVERLADRRLTELYNTWTTKNDRRDEAMIDGVLEYSDDVGFERGVLIVGAAHRQGILDRAVRRLAGTAVSIEEDLSEFWGAGE